MVYDGYQVSPEEYFKETEEYMERFWSNKISSYDLKNRFPRVNTGYRDGKSVSEDYQPEAYDLPEGTIAGDKLAKGENLTAQEKETYEKAYSRYVDLSIMRQAEIDNYKGTKENQELQNAWMNMVTRTCRRWCRRWQIPCSSLVILPPMNSFSRCVRHPHSFARVSGIIWLTNRRCIVIPDGRGRESKLPRHCWI